MTKKRYTVIGTSENAFLVLFTTVAVSKVEALENAFAETGMQTATVLLAGHQKNIMPNTSTEFGWMPAE